MPQLLYKKYVHLYTYKVEFEQSKKEINYMAIRSYSIPEKSRKAIDIDDLVREHCRTKCINVSALIVSLITKWAEDKGITDERRA